MGDKIKWEVIDRPILTPAKELENKASDILADVVYGKSLHAHELEAEAGKLLVQAMKISLFFQ